MEKPFQPYTVREHCLRNNEIDRSKQLQPLIEALKQEKRYGHNEELRNSIFLSILDRQLP